MRIDQKHNLKVLATILIYIVIIVGYVFALISKIHIAGKFILGVCFIYALVLNTFNLYRIKNNQT